MACFIQVHLYTILLFTVVCVSLQIIVKFAFLEHTSGKWTQQSRHLQKNIQTKSQKYCTKAAVMWTSFSVFCNCKLCFTCKIIINKFSKNLISRLITYWWICICLNKTYQNRHTVKNLKFIYLKPNSVCLFVFFEFILPLENFSLIWRRQHCQWRTANFDLCNHGHWAVRVL